MSLSKTKWLRLLTLATACFQPTTQSQQATPANAATPGELLTDPATLHCLAFRWFIAGDDDGDATVKVESRKSGEAWHDALPLLRINREIVPHYYDAEPFRCGNLFAGSVLNLQPDTS